MSAELIIVSNLGNTVFQHKRLWTNCNTVLIIINIQTIFTDETQNEYTAVVTEGITRLVVKEVTSENSGPYICLSGENEITGANIAYFGKLIMFKKRF